MEDGVWHVAQGWVEGGAQYQVHLNLPLNNAVILRRAYAYVDQDFFTTDRPDQATSELTLTGVSNTQYAPWHSSYPNWLSGHEFRHFDKSCFLRQTLTNSFASLWELGRLGRTQPTPAQAPFQSRPDGDQGILWYIDPNAPKNIAQAQQGVETCRGYIRLSCRTANWGTGIVRLAMQIWDPAEKSGIMAKHYTLLDRYNLG
jgi:hypothetical protein